MLVAPVKFKKCRRELKSGNTKNALDLLEEIFTTLKKDDDELTMIMSRYYRGRNKVLNNMVPAHEFEIEVNKITFQILGKLKYLESALKMKNEQIQPDLQILHQINSKLKKVKSRISSLEQELIIGHPFKDGITWLLLIDFNDFLRIVEDNYLEKFQDEQVLKVCNKWRENIKKALFSRKNNFVETAESFFFDDFPFYQNLIDYLTSKWNLSMGEASYLRIGEILEILTGRVQGRS